MITVPTIKKPDSRFTVSDAAERFGKDKSHIRRLCIKYDLGFLVCGRIRLLRKKDLNRLQEHFDEIGRNRKKLKKTKDSA